MCKKIRLEAFKWATICYFRFDPYILSHYEYRHLIHDTFGISNINTDHCDNTSSIHFFLSALKKGKNRKQQKIAQWYIFLIFIWCYFWMYNSSGMVFKQAHHQECWKHKKSNKIHKGLSKVRDSTITKLYNLLI